MDRGIQKEIEPPRGENAKAEIIQMPKPSLGRIVHFVLAEGERRGEHRAAIITSVWSLSAINLQVFRDQADDTPGYASVEAMPTLRCLLVRHDENKAPGTWHWPERE